MTLVVGHHEERLYVSEDILLQIPYFRDILANRSADYVHQMPTSQPTAVADVLYFNWMKAVPAIKKQDKDIDLTKLEGTTTRYVWAYVTAASWGLEWVRKCIRKAIVIHQRTEHVNPNNLLILYNHNLQQSSLYKFLLAELGHNIHKHGLAKFKHANDGFETTCESMPQEIVWELLKSADAIIRKPEQPAMQDHWLIDDLEEDKEE